MIMHSGGANGADSLFARMAEKKDVTVINHSFKGHRRSSRDGKYIEHPIQKMVDEVEKIYSDTCKLLGKRKIFGISYTKKLLYRNYYQVINSDVIIGVGRIIDQYTCKVDGGTGYAISYAFLLNKKIYFFDQFRKQWFFSDGKRGFIPSKLVPSLSFLKEKNIKQFAGIGTRDLNKEGVNAIKKIFLKK